MKVTKFGHACLLIEEGDTRILTDPGNYSTTQNSVRSVDAILVTHEHPDHLDVPSLKAVLAQSPDAVVFTNRGAGKVLAGEGIAYELLEHGQRRILKGVPIEGHGERHAAIYPTIAPVVNTGYFIAERFFYPGDALYQPERAVEILALPVAGPWLKLAEAIDYAQAVKPKTCFPVHDGMLKFAGSAHRIPESVLMPLGVVFSVIEVDSSKDL